MQPTEPARRVFSDPVTDSSRWSAFEPRPGDIVVCTPAKSGTTWVQAILALLISGDPEVDAQVSSRSPWIDITVRPVEEVMARLEAQDHRRQVKTHSPLDCVPYWDALRYVTVYRHPIDVHFSARKHVANMRFDLGLAPMATDPAESFRAFLVNDADHLGLPCLLDHYRRTLEREPRPNLLRLHYADMRRDLPGAVARIAGHVGIEHAPAHLARLTEAARFESMRAAADRFAPGAGSGLWRSDAAFFDSGTSGKWRGVLGGAELSAYDAAMDAALTPEERAWLEWGDAGA